MNSAEINEKVAQLWCQPKHSGKEMDVDFCESIISLCLQIDQEAFNRGLEEAAKESEDLWHSKDCIRNEKSVVTRVAKAIRSLKKGEVK